MQSVKKTLDNLEDILWLQIRNQVPFVVRDQVTQYTYPDIVDDVYNIIRRNLYEIR